MGVQNNLSDQVKNKKSDIEFFVSFENLSDSAKEIRIQDTANLKKFNSDVKAWSRSIENKLKGNIRQLTNMDIALSDSIKAGYKRDKGEINRIGFSMLREGIYLQKGAGRGQGGYIGSQWTDIYGKLKKTNKKSLGKQGLGGRHAVDWYNSILEKELSTLADIVSNYSSDLQLDATKLYLKD